MAPLRKTIHWVAFLVALLFMLAPASAPADDAADTFKRALELFDEGNCEEALPLFETAYDATQSPNARLYVARCLVQLERLIEAYREMKGTVDVAREKATGDPKYVATRDAAAAELAQLEPRVGKLVVALPEAPEGATIEVDGRPIEEDQRGVPFPVEPGTITVVAAAPGKETVTREIEIAGGETKTVALLLRDAQATVEPPDEEGPWLELSGVQIGGIVVGVLGLGGLVTFGATGSMAKSRFDRLAEECGGVRCTNPDYASVVDEGKTLQTVANVTAVVGSVLLAGGVAMIVFGGDDGDEAISAAAAPLPGGAAGTVRVSF